MRTQSSVLDNVVVVLVSTRNPLNIGAAARAMTNFGFSQLRVVNPYQLAFREAKSAVRAAAVLRDAQEFSSLADAIADCTLVVGTTAARDRKLDHPLRVLQHGATLIRREMSSGKVALVFGSEKRGLSNQDFSHCDWLMRIQTQPQQPSMNLGQAVAVCLYAISRSRRVVTADQKERKVRSADLERLAEVLCESLVLSGYSKRNEKEVVRTLLRRLRFSEDDSQLLLGMLRKMLWKMRN